MPQDPKKSPVRYENEVAAFRQPMVTSLGIILGFLLAFLANWAIDDDGGPVFGNLADAAVFVSLAGAIMLFTLVLFRLLDNRIHPEPGRRYQATFRLYIGAIILTFSGLGFAAAI